MRNFPASWLKFLKRFWKESKTSFMTFSAFRMSPRRLHNSGLTSEAQFWRRIRTRRRTFAQADVAIEMGSRSDSKTFLGTRMHWLSSADGLRSQKNFARAQFNVSSEYFEWKWRDFDHFWRFWRRIPVHWPNFRAGRCRDRNGLAQWFQNVPGD